ncbi:AzlD domain-containing protein [Geodermatophilus sp. DSM 44513]|uniref:AzlD domain-containing protein n=1 Tax=Geodermatophilus sp. DSM 44513 TaxID=1528104 RepID=UPI00128007C7|nr:AzlD domain-containing protein [Geodermatophilus sp. DSM 44513]WNV74298.1 AzlD domain-containing protein [Geodermatophilus sp. DSM 44513]
MSVDPGLVTAVALLATGTLALRLSGLLLRRRIDLTPRTQTLIATTVAVLFCAVVATSTLLQDGQWPGPARLAGVLVAGILAWRGTPLVLIGLAAAVTTACLRLLGIP